MSATLGRITETTEGWFYLFFFKFRFDPSPLIQKKSYNLPFYLKKQHLYLVLGTLSTQSFVRIKSFIFFSSLALVSVC